MRKKETYYCTTAKERRSMELNSKLVELCSLIIAEKLRNNGVFNGGDQISDGRRNSDFIVGVLIIVNNPLFHLPNFDYNRNSRSDNPSYHLLNRCYFRLLLHLHRLTSRRCILRSRNWPRFIPRFFSLGFWVSLWYWKFVEHTWIPKIKFESLIIQLKIPNYKQQIQPRGLDKVSGGTNGGRESYIETKKGLKFKSWNLERELEGNKDCMQAIRSIWDIVAIGRFNMTKMVSLCYCNS